MTSTATANSDPSKEAVLAAFGVTSDAFLGSGGEASIYALDEHRVLRVLHSGKDAGQPRRAQALLRDLVRSAVPFHLPEIMEVGETGGRVYAIERRLPGRSMLEVLHSAEGPDRDRLIEAFLLAAASLGDLRPEGWAFYGELASAEPLRAATWREFLTMRAAQSLAAAGPPLDRIDPEALASDLPEPTRAEFVHLDAFAGNVLANGTGITAVLDLGYACVAGDRRFNPLVAAAYLDPRHDLFGYSTDRDRDIAQGWLRSLGLLDLLEPTRRWLAAYWAMAVDDLPLQAWCRSVLFPSD
jgi:aminoglycoside phosphotransferase